MGKSDFLYNKEKIATRNTIETTVIETIETPLVDSSPVEEKLQPEEQEDQGDQENEPEAQITVSGNYLFSHSSSPPEFEDRDPFEGIESRIKLTCDCDSIAKDFCENFIPETWARDVSDNFVIFNFEKSEWDRGTREMIDSILTFFFKQVKVKIAKLEKSKRVPYQKFFQSVTNCRRIVSLIYSHVNSGDYKDKLREVKPASDFPHLVPIKGNRVLNLETRTIERRSFFIDFPGEMPVDYIDTSNGHPLIDNFFEQSFPVQLETFLSQIGYSFTGRNDRQLIYILYGNPMAGKSLCLSFIREMMSSFAGYYGANILSGQGSKAHDSDYYGWPKHRVAIIDSYQEDGFDFQRVSKITSWMIPIRLAREKKIQTYVNQTKLWLAANKSLKVDLREEWIRRRLVFFQFRTPKTIDRGFLQKFESDQTAKDYFFSRAINAYLTESEEIPHEVLKYTSIVADKGNPVLEWATENLTPCTDKNMTYDQRNPKIHDIFEQYKLHCVQSSKKPVTKSDFFKIVKAYYPTKTRENIWRVSDHSLSPTDVGYESEDEE